MYSHCTTGGWILGNTIDGTQAEFVRTPHADTSLYPIPDGADEEALVMLSDILPTGFECGVLNGKVQPGSTVAIVGSGPVGLAALLTAQFFSPAEIIMIDLDDNRLEMAKRFGATSSVNSADGKAVETVMKMTGNRGVDTAIEAVGIPATFEMCEKIVAPGGNIANIGVHGQKVALHLECLWDRNISITTRLVDTVTIPMLFKTVQISQDRSQAADYPSLQARPHPRCLRDLRQRRQDESAQGDHRSLERHPPCHQRQHLKENRSHDLPKALEEPGPDENPVIVSIEPQPREIVAQILSALNMVERAQPRKQTSLGSSVLGA